MDPLCGMTRGAAATMRGDLGEAWWYNSASPLVIVGGFLVLGRWLLGRLAGLWIDVRVLATPLVIAVGGLGLLALEVNQQLHVDRLRWPGEVARHRRPKEAGRTGLYRSSDGGATWRLHYCDGD